MSSPEGKTATENNKWVPLEANPEVFNSWANQAGLITSQDQFVDVYGLDPELLSIIPQPTKAVILLFPLNPSIKEKRAELDKAITEEGQHSVDPTLVYVRQNVENACGTIALIHAIVNSSVTYAPESPLQKFIDLCKDKTPEERGKLFESTDLFTKIHLQSSALGQTHQPSNENNGMNTDLHFTCFVAAPDAQVRETAGTSLTTKQPADNEQSGNMRLVELDGRRDRPIDHGPCTNVLNDAIRVIKKYYLSHAQSIYFSLMALGPAPIDSPFI